MKPVHSFQPVSAPIPIPYNHNHKNYRNSKVNSIITGSCEKKYCSCSPKTNSFSDDRMKQTLASSAPVLIDFDRDNEPVAFHDEFYFSIENEDEVYAQSCPLSTKIKNISSVHLVNGLNIDKNIVQTEHLYVLCDSPKIKDVSNTLSYHILDSRKGILSFTNEDHIQVLREYLHLPYHVVKIKRNDLINYNKLTKTSSIVLYNSYTDVESKSSYFLYFELDK
jgi:hypothetical protein